jgi:4-diphosphocytidyl-2-C-methyl-D-erythritol kinase
MTGPLTLQAPAKVNLFLRVFGTMHDGYHAVETLMALTTLADELRFERRTELGVELETDATDLGPAADNLVTRAAELVLAATGRRFGVRVQLTKRIPARAGLGGGSSDAAQALLGVNHLANDAVPTHELLQLAARLGSDVPFFLGGARLALAWHRGERMLRLPSLPAAPALLLVPSDGVETAHAYRWLDQQRTSVPDRGGLALDLEALSSWGDIARMAGNDFESPVFTERPAIRAAFEKLVGTGPMLCRMTGSGSALVALYRNARDRDDAQAMLSRRLGRILPVEVG